MGTLPSRAVRVPENPGTRARVAIGRFLLDFDGLLRCSRFCARPPWLSLLFGAWIDGLQAHGYLDGMDRRYFILATIYGRAPSGLALIGRQAPLSCAYFVVSGQA